MGLNPYGLPNLFRCLWYTESGYFKLYSVMKFDSLYLASFCGCEWRHRFIVASKLPTTMKFYGLNLTLLILGFKRLPARLK